MKLPFLENLELLVYRTNNKGNCVHCFAFTGRERLIRSHSSARFCFELSGNSNKTKACYSNSDQNFELEISLN